MLMMPATGAVLMLMYAELSLPLFLVMKGW
jgi:hypothetical protein